MGKNLIIGGASNYTMDHLRPWVNSIKATGFDGDIVLCATNMGHGDLANLANNGVNLLLYGQQTQEGYYQKGGVPHVDRFFYIWRYLDECEEKYDRIIVTDTRDVIFQKNPFNYNYFNPQLMQAELFVTGEGLKYKDEPWGMSNIQQALGPFFSDRLANEEIYNVGVFGGTHSGVKAMCLLLFTLGMGKGIVDQAMFNFIINEGIIGASQFSQSGGFAINLGTTIKAIEAGKGDLGLNAVMNPTIMEAYKKNYLTAQPKITDDGRVLNSTEEYYIVHQYDRVPELNKLILERYGNG